MHFQFAGWLQTGASSDRLPTLRGRSPPRSTFLEVRALWLGEIHHFVLCAPSCWRDAVLELPMPHSVVNANEADLGESKFAFPRSARSFSCLSAFERASVVRVLARDSQNKAFDSIFSICALSASISIRCRSITSPNDSISSSYNKSRTCSCTAGSSTVEHGKGAKSWIATERPSSCVFVPAVTVPVIERSMMGLSPPDCRATLGSPESGLAFKSTGGFEFERGEGAWP